MKRSLLAAAAAALLMSCAASPRELPADASAQEIIQRAQEASDRSAWEEAVAGYSLLLERFGSDTDLLCAGEYEIAFIRYKQGRWAESKEGFDRLLARYAAPGAEALPGRYKVLAEKILPQVEAKLSGPK